MGRAEELFVRIKSAGEAAVTALIADAQPENLWLDFKRAGNDGRGSKLHESDWKNYAKALSGFANSDGGVIIWGVDCSSDPVLGDVPKGPSPIENPSRFVSWLDNATSACTVPAVPGVESFAVTTGTNTGYAITLIPTSPLAPHQCVKPTGSLHYYLRAGSNFMQVPHAVLAGMFGRRPHPKVFQTYSGTAVIERIGQQMRLKLNVFVYFTNEGPAIARDAFMHLLVASPGASSRIALEVDPDDSGLWIKQVRFGGIASVVAVDGFRVAPQMIVKVFRVHIDLLEPFEDEFGIKISSGCDGAPMHVAERWLPVAELQKTYQVALRILVEDRSAETQAIDLFLPR